MNLSLPTAICLAPLLGALLVALIPRNYRFVIRTVALLATLVGAVLAVKMFLAFDPNSPEFQFTQTIPWVRSLGLSLRFGVDGINVGLVLMGAIVAFAAACLSKEIKTREKEFYFLLLVMAGGILGAFASLDLFFFYFFHELALVPTFLMIGVWGHGARKDYATFQITLYLSLGALIALAGLIALYLQMPAGERTFDMVKMASHFDAHPISVANQKTIFPLLLFGFGVLVSLWPFHTWAPLGYGSAPSPTAMLHAGVLKKFGLYGLIRIALPMMPQGAKVWMHLLGLLCLGNILYCGWVAMRQRDLNLLLGNSSVAHMGLAFLGLASVTLLGITGTILIMVAHGFLAALSFGLSGYLRQQLGTLEISEMGGLAKKMPFLGTIMIMALLAGCGLPGFANFPGELLVMFGAWHFGWNFVAVAAWGALVVGAIYALRAVRNIWHGSLPDKWAAAPLLDARDSAGWSLFNPWRKLPFLVLISCLLAFGVYPQLLVGTIEPSVAHLLKREPPKPPPRKTGPPPTRPKRSGRGSRETTTRTNAPSPVVIRTTRLVLSLPTTNLLVAPSPAPAQPPTPPVAPTNPAPAALTNPAAPVQPAK
jgi:NADH-quinone oxidoreductase subunit M